MRGRLGSAIAGHVASALVAIGATACGPTVVVDRAYDGRVVSGRYVEPEGYAAFLRGVLAEAGGDPRGALGAYEAVSRLDRSSPEVWTRIGAVRCSVDPGDRAADDAFARALEAEPGYERAWAARATCAIHRGDAAGAREATMRASTLKETVGAAGPLFHQAVAEARDPAAHDALLALDVTARDPEAAWTALAAWAEARGDVRTWARASRSLAQVAPTARDAVAQAAEALAGIGAVEEARLVAASAAVIGTGPLAEDRYPLAARLAVDDAIARRDADLVRARATRVRISLEEAAARAELAGESVLASDLATSILAADPGAVGATWVLAAIHGEPSDSHPPTARRGEPPSGASLVVRAVALARVHPAEARGWLAAAAHRPIIEGDDRVVRPAVALVSRGVLTPTVLPADGAVELAALSGDGPGPSLREGGEDTPGRGRASAATLDPRHEYLALALAHTTTARARELGRRLASVAASDPVVASASALVMLGEGARIGVDVPGALLARDPADPLLAATALRLAEKIGDSDVARRARATLSGSSVPRDAGQDSARDKGAVRPQSY